MAVIPMLVVLLFIVGAFSFLWWGLSRMAIPEPIKTILLVIVGLIMLYAIYSVVVEHHPLM